MRQGRSMRNASLAAVTLIGLFAAGGAAEAADENPVVLFETNQGNITVELYPDKAPITVENFLRYVDAGFYFDTVFHRVIPGFMIQGGGFTEGLKEKRTLGGIPLEARKGLSNEKGTIAMARTSQPNSATAQFFINLEDNKRLDTLGGGYAVFGKVIDGMDVVEKIAGVPTGPKAAKVLVEGTLRDDTLEDVPTEPVVIKRAYRKPNP